MTKTKNIRFAAAARGAVRRSVCGLLLAACGLAAQAHKASDSYLQIDATDAGLAVRWDIALRDLDAVVDIDADVDGRLTWAEIKDAWPRIEQYALGRLQIDGCSLRPERRALERRNDGAYAVMFLSAPGCKLAAAPLIRYGLLREVDPTHRGIAKIQRPDQPVALSVLDPTASAPVAPTTGAGAAGAATPQPAASGFFTEGIRHILTGYDHVLFLLCLLLPSVMRRTPQGWRPVERLSEAVLPIAGIVTAFTVAHSLTLGLAAMKVVSLSPAVIEPAIAVTIILAALDNVWPIFPVPRVVVTFLFGLIHGFGFAGVLGELNLPRADFAWALLQFNLGLEAGQLLIVVVVSALLFLVRARRRYPTWVIRGGSYAAMLLGAVWLIERTADFAILPL